jgi:hypothetical protein
MTRFLIGRSFRGDKHSRWADPLEEINIVDGITPRLIFLNKNISLEQKDAIIKLIMDYIDCFT